MSNKAKNAKMLAKVNDITRPYEAASTEREYCELTGFGGRIFTLGIPLSAAVELELRGYSIKVY